MEILLLIGLFIDSFDIKFVERRNDSLDVISFAIYFSILEWRFKLSNDFICCWSRLLNVWM